MTTPPPKPRPVHRDYPRRLNPYRIPEDGPLTPRLRLRRSDISLVGFHHDYQEMRDED